MRSPDILDVIKNSDNIQIDDVKDKLDKLDGRFMFNSIVQIVSTSYDKYYREIYYK